MTNFTLKCYIFDHIYLSTQIEKYLKNMSVKITYSKQAISKSSHNLVLFCNDKFNINVLKKYLSTSEYSYISDLLKSNDLKKNLLVFEVNSKKKIIIISIKNDLKSSDIENLGAEFYKRVNHGKNSEYILNSDSVLGNNENFVSHFLHGFKLKSYEFKNIKKKKIPELSRLIFLKQNKPSTQNQLKFSLEEELYARDLVSEPENVLHPDEYAKRLNSLRKDGLK